VLAGHDDDRLLGLSNLAADINMARVARMTRRAIVAN
jgi:hypothetical protein